MSWFKFGKNEEELDEETEEFEEEAEDTFEEEEEAEEQAPAAPKTAARFELHNFGGKTNKPAAKEQAPAQNPAPAPKPIIDFNQTQGGNYHMDSFGGRSQILLYKPESLDVIRTIADRVNEKKTVILNLEDKDEDFIKTFIDFFSGVAYANRGKLSPVTGKTYILTPEDVDMASPGGTNIGDSELGSLNLFDVDTLDNNDF